MGDYYAMIQYETEMGQECDMNEYYEQAYPKPEDWEDQEPDNTYEEF